MKLEEFFPLIFCINMDSRPDRWEKTQKEFEKIGIKNVKRFSEYIMDNLDIYKDIIYGN